MKSALDRRKESVKLKRRKRVFGFGLSSFLSPLEHPSTPFDIFRGKGDMVQSPLQFLER